MGKSTEVNVEAGKVIDALRSGQTGVIEGLFDEHRSEFSAWAAKSYRATPVEIKEIWKDVIVVFDGKVKSGQLTELRCSVKTFLFAIGKKRLLKNHEKRNRLFYSKWEGDVDDLLANDLRFATFMFDDDDDIWEEERLLLLAAMKTLSPKCQEMMVKRHYEGWSIAEIMAQFEYDNKNSTTASLSTCLKNLKETIKKMSKK